MTRDRRLLLLLGLLMAYGLFVVECRYHQRDDATTTEAKHRHRHRHESSNRRGHHELDKRFGRELDYEYDYGDSEDSIDEDDYEARSYYDHSRSHHRFAPKSYHNRMFEPRYPSRYHNGGYHTGNGWYNENNDRRRISTRHSTKNHRYGWTRPYHRPAYSRNHDMSHFDDGTKENYDYERSHRYGNGKVNKHHERWRNSPYTPFRRDWRNRMYGGYHGARRYRLEDHEDAIDRADATRWMDDWKRKSNSSDSKYHFVKNDRKVEEDEDYDDYGGLEEDDKDEDEDDTWKDIADDRNENDEEKEFDNDFYKGEVKEPPLKTYDDIIRRLTSDDPITPKSSVKRDFRNIETNKHVKRDDYKNLKNESRNVSRIVDLFTSTSHAANTTYLNVNKRTAENSTDKSIGHKPRNTIGEMVKGHDRQEGKVVDTQAKAKSLEQDYEEYLNSPDNEKEDDLAKAGIEDDSAVQADVTNTDYIDDDNGDEDEDTFPTSSTTSTTTTTTTKTTTMRPKLSLNRHYGYRDPRAYDSVDSGTGAEYNGYQAKNNYPQMSAHSILKWQSLGTREGVKETRSHMQQLNKTGRNWNNRPLVAEILEARQHAAKVDKEGSCQWPRKRVIPVRDVYPNPSTSYSPHCVILHRCSDDTGCCKSEEFTCVPKNLHHVQLFFYTTSIGGTTVVKKLSFHNHTECECRERSDTTSEKLADRERVFRHYQSSSPPQNIKQPPSRKPCRCPTQFTPTITEGVCQCNCFVTDQNCMKIRRGKGYFSNTDRICIQNNECAIPNCEFGDYITNQGKCPGKRETFDAMTNYKTNHRFRK